MYRKGVSALIINKNQEILLVNLEAFEERFFAIPGGGIEDGETREDAVYREINEELGIHKNVLELVGESSDPLHIIFKTGTLHRDGVEYDGMERYFFGFRFIGDATEIRCQEVEVRAYRWVTFRELKNYLLFDNQLEETIEKIREIFPEVG